MRLYHLLHPGPFPSTCGISSLLKHRIKIKEVPSLPLHALSPKSGISNVGISGNREGPREGISGSASILTTKKASIPTSLLPGRNAETSDREGPNLASVFQGPAGPEARIAARSTGGAACSGGRCSAEGAEDLLCLSRAPAPGLWHTLLPPHCLRSPPRNHWPSLRECVGAIRKRLPRQPCPRRLPPSPEGMRHTLHRPTLSSHSSFLSRCGLWGWVVVRRTRV